MTSVDPYFGRQYHRAKYNCLHFARDVWADITGVDISNKLAGLFEVDRKVRKKHIQVFHRVERPIDPCLVLLTRPHFAHIGVYLRGKILHIRPEGVAFQPFELVQPGFTNVRFYV